MRIRVQIRGLLTGWRKVATEVHTSLVTIPAGTPQNAPVLIDVSFSAMITEAVDWRVPRGPSGLMGWRLTSGGAQVLPKNLGQWVITDNEGGHWVLEDLHDSGKWEVQGYNTGTHNHSVHVRFHVSPIGRKGSWPNPPLISLYSLTSAADLTAAPPEAFQSAARLRPPVQYRAPD